MGKLVAHPEQNHGAASPEAAVPQCLVWRSQLSAIQEMSGGGLADAGGCI
eukprot:SAG31_NODE_34412_length_333_cov_0.867521_1_plen_49_part_01